MWSYGFKLAAAAMLLMVAGVVAIVIFEDIWTRVGLGAAIVIVVGGLLGFAWYVNRKDRQARAGIDELPHI
jgi:Flp pilus assembly protein TadB